MISNINIHYIFRISYLSMDIHIRFISDCCIWQWISHLSMIRTRIHIETIKQIWIWIHIYLAPFAPLGITYKHMWLVSEGEFLISDWNKIISLIIWFFVFLKTSLIVGQFSAMFPYFITTTLSVMVFFSCQSPSVTMLTFWLPVLKQWNFEVIVEVSFYW